DGALVLFPDARRERDLLPGGGDDFRLAPDFRWADDSSAAARKSAADERVLPDCADCSAGDFCTIPVFVAARVEQHGGAARRFPGWTNRRARRAVVFDGIGAAPFSLAARCQDLGFVAGKRDGNDFGVLDCSDHGRADLDALPGTARFAWFRTARSVFCFK